MDTYNIFLERKEGERGIVGLDLLKKKGSVDK